MKSGEIWALAEKHAAWAIEKRRELHKVPELDWDLVKTFRIVSGALEEMGIAYRTIRTGIVALIPGRGPGRTVALRADMDALPVNEPEGCPFISTHPGRMHACGHDAHTSILLGTARALKECEFNGQVKLLFQPAEETEGGADPMIAQGCMEDPHVDEVYGLHVMPYLPAGHIECREGALNAASDRLEITVYGRSGHGAYPDTSRDAIVCVAQVISALQTLVSRNVSPLQSAVLSLCTIQGGTANNVICGEVKMTGTLRTVSPELREFMKRRIREAAEGVAQAMDCRAVVEFKSSYCALINPPEYARKVLGLAREMVGEDKTHVKEASSMGAEDFAYYLLRAPGAFYHLGCGYEGEENAPLHSPKFRVNEDCIKTGIAMQTALALNALNQ